MKTTLLEISNYVSHIRPESQLSFNPFLRNLETRINTQTGLKSKYFEFVIAKFKNAETPYFSAAEAGNYDELLEIIHFVLTPIAAGERDLYWALGTPFPTQLFYSTDNFENLFKRNTRQKEFSQPDDHESKIKKQLRFIYGLILERFYGVENTAQNNLILSSTDEETGLARFYEIHADMRFVDIQIKGKLPELKYELLKTYLKEGSETDAVAKTVETCLPLNLFRFEGFSVITLRDITVQQMLEGIKNTLANHEYDEEHVRYVLQTMKTLAGKEAIEFGLLPFIQVNGKSMALVEEYFHSMISDLSRNAGLSGKHLHAFVKDYESKPRIMIYRNIQKENSSDPFINLIKERGIESFVLLPVYHQQQLTGVLEIYSNQHIVFDEDIYTKIQPAIPLIAQLLNYWSAEYCAGIENMVMEKFTSLQSSIRWKFTEAAWKHLQRYEHSASLTDIETVRFENVYPLYGAIDVRNSTEEQNKAAREDIESQRELLNTMIGKITAFDQDCPRNGQTEWNTWKDKVDECLSTGDANSLNEFLTAHVHPYLSQIAAKFPFAKQSIDSYFQCAADANDPIHSRRQQLERSLKLLTTGISQFLDENQKELQGSFPFYFEKFRSDGIEYDMYIGESIAPARAFSMDYVKKLRLWQLESMAELARITSRLAEQMPVPLQTTQLIFVHSSPIDICFRNDERRFDVEGAYNIRYEVIKKRIDKAIIKGSQERLTQPGKIAVIYFNTTEQEEYMEYIKTLQEKKLIQSEVEYLELEELHGVPGIQALRLSIDFDADIEKSPVKKSDTRKTVSFAKS